MPKPIDLFIDTSALPREMGHEAQAVERIIELVEANALRVHLSDVAIREWKSQMVDEFVKKWHEAHSAVNSLMRHPWAKALSYQTQLGQLVALKTEIAGNATEIALQKCESLLTRMRAVRLLVDEKDGMAVVDDYFSGAPPFRQPKSRQDFPDSFVYMSARRLATNVEGPLNCICKDKGLRGALSTLQDVATFEHVTDFLQSGAAQEAMEPLQLARLWTKQKRAKTISFLSSTGNTGALSRLIEALAVDEISGGATVHDSRIPDDNGEASISSVDEVRDIEIEWSKVHDFGPGWISVPFKFTCEVELEFMVYRADSFHVPKWVHVEIGDFEEDYYFRASGYRDAVVSGMLAICFTSEELAAKNLALPSDIAVDSIDDIELHPQHFSDDDYPGDPDDDG